MKEFEGKAKFECTACGERCEMVAFYIDDSEADAPETLSDCPWGRGGALWKPQRKCANDEAKR